MESARTYQNMTVVQLRELARANKVRLPYGVNKAQMVETLFRQLGSGAKEEPAEKPEIGLYKPKPFGFYDEEYGTSNPVVPQMLKAGLLGSGPRPAGSAARRIRAFCVRRTERRGRTISMFPLRRSADSICTAATKSSARRGRSGWAIDTTR